MVLFILQTLILYLVEKGGNIVCIFINSINLFIDYYFNPIIIGEQKGLCFGTALKLLFLF